MLNYSYKTNKKKIIYRKLKTMKKFIIYMITLIGLMMLYIKCTNTSYTIPTVHVFIMAILAFTPFILPSWIKSKLNERKERKKEEERLKYQQYLDSLPKEPEVEIPKSVYFAEDDEEFVKEFGKPTLNRKLFENKVIKNVRYAGENYGPNSFKLITKSFDYNGLYYDGIYNENINAYEILNMPEHYDLYDIKYVKYCELLHLVEYEEDTDTLLIY